MRKPFIRFLIAGLVNTILSYLVYLLLLELFSYTIAYSISYCIGIVISYILNARYVFVQPLNLRRFIQFPIVYVVQYTLGIAILKILIETVSIDPKLSMVFVILITTPVTFLLSKFVMERPHNNKTTIIDTTYPSKIDTLKLWIVFIKNKIFIEHIIFLITSLVIISMFFFNLFSLTSHSVDIPIDDDWRDISHQNAGSFSLPYLFTPSNDTMYVTGRFFDSLSIYLFSGNNILYQSTSFLFVLGGLTYLQFSLLRKFAVNKLVLAIGIFPIIFMLQSGTYWGIQSCAYHQALPILSILIILLIIVGRIVSHLGLHAFCIFFIGTLGGLSYISGAIALLSITVWTMFVLSVAPKKMIPYYKSSAIGIGMATLVTLPVQLWVILFAQKGLISSSNPWALPIDIDFWAFFLGMFARAIGFFNNSSISSLLLASLVFIAILSSFIFLFYDFWVSNEDNIRERKFNLLYLYGVLFFAVFSYAIIVSAGRANLRPDTVSSFRDIFSHAQLRFHFFWLTILLPWVAIILGNYLTFRFNYIISRLTIAFFIVISVTHVIHVKGAFDFTSFYTWAAERKSNALACVYEKEIHGERVVCPDILDGDVTEAVAFAKKLGLSFANSIRIKEDVDTSTYTLVPSPSILLDGEKIELVFTKKIITYNVPIKKIGIMFGTYARTNEGEGTIRLHSKEGGGEEIGFDLSTLKDNEYKFFNVTPALYNSGEFFSKTGEGVSLWKSDKDGLPFASCLSVEYANGTNLSTPGCPKPKNYHNNTVIYIFSLFAAMLLLFATNYKGKTIPIDSGSESSLL
ncbi:MAG: GtrA family protein [Methylococcales bacterium]|nr:GtrA family protein [Methylococcales bacterium]